jgi:hypothetical protein
MERPEFPAQSSVCRRCRSLLDQRRSQHGDRFAPNTCDVCGWINFTRSGCLLDAALMEALRLLPEVFDGVNPPASDGGEELTVWVRRLRDRLTAWVGTVMHENEAAAVTWLLIMLSSLAELGQQPKGDRLSVYSVQLVYLHFLYEGSVPLSTPRVSELPSFWTRDITTVALLCHFLSQVLREAELGHELRLEGDRLLVLTEDEAAIWAEEVNANQERNWEPSTDLMIEAFADPDVRQAEQLVFGYSIFDMLRAVIAPDELQKCTKVVTTKEYFFVELSEAAPPRLKEVLRRLALTRGRLSRQIAPDFLYQADAPILRDTATALEETGAFDWLTFAPVMLGTYDERSESCPVAIVSNYLVHRAIMKCYTGVSRRLAVAEQASKQIGPEAARAVAELKRQFHRRLETRVAETLRDIGLIAIQGLAELDGPHLECGEIDVLAVGTGAGGELIVLICEVKDTDLSFFKDYGPREALEVARRAHGQAQRKATSVAQHWLQLSRLFTPSAQPQSSEARFVAVAVPRITSLPVAEGAASIPFPELGPVGASLLTDPPSAWRPDLQRALVVPNGVGI